MWVKEAKALSKKGSLTYHDFLIMEHHKEFNQEYNRLIRRNIEMDAAKKIYEELSKQVEATKSALKFSVSAMHANVESYVGGLVHAMSLVEKMFPGSATSKESTPSSKTACKCARQSSSD